MENFENSRNPILPIEYHIPDSEAHVMPDGKLYVYGSYDDRSDLFCSDRYHVVSTGDMEKWTLHEVALRGQSIPWFNDPDAKKYPGIDWSKPTPFIKKMMEGMDLSGEKDKFEMQEKGMRPPILFAPDAAYKKEKYYLYFCMPDDSEGVSVSDRPEGPFTDPMQLPCGGIDPAIFIDDDGQAYYYWGQLFSHGVKMNDDMMSFDETKIVHDLVTEEEHFFHEGSSMRKIGDTYYYVYANMERGKPTSLGYSTSKSPLGPFSYKGIIIDNDGCDPASWNNHGSIECFQDQWYVFYHRCSRGVQQYRRLCIEPITILEDGTIEEVKMTSQGPGKPFTNGETIYGYQACELHGKVFIDRREKYGEVLTNIHDGDEIIFRYIASETGFREFNVKAEGSGCIELFLNNESHGLINILDGNLLGEVPVIEAGRYEICLSIHDPEDFTIIEINLN
ncbi:MAG: family 43 glycosylhydrolase [Lachnospiraceae bacterium]